MTDMGGWQERLGALYRLRREADGYQRERLLADLDRPHGVRVGPDGKVYVGVVGGILRIDTETLQREDVVGGNSGSKPLPSRGRHPLTQFVFDGDKNLFVNVGSASDHCEHDDGSPPRASQACAESEGDSPLAAIYRFKLRWPEGNVVASETYARGLRNSLALAIDERSGELFAAENSRDAIHLAMPRLKNDENLPHDELNRIETGRHYGWPYCFDNARASPEYPKHDCRATTQPVRLLPAHAAPLGMSVAKARDLPAACGDALVVAYHGYRKHGHRLVCWPLGPKLFSAASFDLISNWVHNPHGPRGAPTDIAVGADGAIFITEDRNGTVLRFVRER